MNNYFNLVWDPHYPDPWWLGEVACETAPIDCRIFTYGVPQTVAGTLRIPITTEGEPLPFTFAAFNVPVVTREIGDIIAAHAPEAVQRFPVKVGDASHEYEVLNIVRLHDAVDRERAGYMLWRPEHGRPDKVGAFKQIHKMVFRPEMQGPPHIFRLMGWKVAVVVSKKLMHALGGPLLRGVKFKPIEQ